MEKIWKAYQYLFYKYYTWSVWLNRGCNPYSYHAGWGLLSLLLCVNLFTLSVISEIFTGYGFTQIGQQSHVPIIASIVIFLFINYFIFLRSRRYVWIIKKFENEDRKSKIKGNFFAWGYIIVTLGLFMSSAFLLRYFRPPQMKATSEIISQDQQQAIIAGEEQIIRAARNIPSSSDPNNDKLHLPYVQND